MNEFNQGILNGLPNQGRIVDEAGTSQNIAELLRKLNTAMDPFGVLRVTEYQPVFSTTPKSVSVLEDRDFKTGAAVIEVVNGEYRLYNPGGETCRLETSQRGRYQSGLVGVPGVGARRTTAPTGTTTYYIGYFEGDRGFGFKEDVDGFHTFVRRDGAEVYSRPRSEWVDPLDGSGPSGRTLDILDGHIHRFPFLHYGYGSIEFGFIIEAVDNGGQDEFIVVDRYRPENSISLRDPNLPITVEIAGDSEGEIFVGGRQYGVYGQLNLRRRIVGELRTGQPVDEANGFVPAVSAKVRMADPWRSIPTQVSGFSLFTDTDLDWIIVVGNTLDSSNFAISQFSQGDTSVVFNTDALTSTGGEILAGPEFVRAGGGTNRNAANSNIPVQDIPVGEPVTLLIRPHSGTGTVRSALRMAELR